jgi:hypothetical protein
LVTAKPLRRPQVLRFFVRENDECFKPRCCHVAFWHAAAVGCVVESRASRGIFISSALAIARLLLSQLSRLVVPDFHARTAVVTITTIQYRNAGPPWAWYIPMSSSQTTPEDHITPPSGFLTVPLTPPPTNEKPSLRLHESSRFSRIFKLGGPPSKTRRLDSNLPKESTMR